MLINTPSFQLSAKAVQEIVVMETKPGGFREEVVDHRLDQTPPLGVEQSVIHGCKEPCTGSGFQESLGFELRVRLGDGVRVHLQVLGEFAYRWKPAAILQTSGGYQDADLPFDLLVDREGRSWVYVIHHE